MGLLDQYAGQQQPQGGAMMGAPMGGGMPQGGAPQMPPEMIQVIEHLKQLDPVSRQQAVQQITQKIQASGQPPQQIASAVQQFMAAVGG